MSEDLELVASEDFVNLTTETRYGSSDWEETWTDDVGRLYRNAVREYGRCTGHVYSDFSGVSYAVGWVFVKRRRAVPLPATSQ